MALLPVAGSALSAKFSGPYDVRERLSDTDYVISTPEKRWKNRVCHVNMLKLYHARETKTGPVDSLPSQTTVPGNTSDVSALIVTDQPDLSVCDYLEPCPSVHQGMRLRNSQALQALPSELQHLTAEQQ